MQKILIVEDDTNINNLLQEALSKEGYSCEQAFSGTEAKLLLNMQEYSYALVLLDLMLPGIPGEAVLEEIRKKGNLPVIVLTAKDSLDEKVEILTSGADDYITKPFNPREVVARVKAVLRRSQHTWREEESLQYDELDVNLAERSVRVAGVEVELTAKEMELLWYLAKHPGRVFSREQLLEAIWGYEYFGDTRTVDTHIKRLRQKIAAGRTKGAWDIRTVWGVGYKFEVGV